ncbi:hypothetical protein E3N88_15092 [Mikania micrantha]|uniref:Uncharacterized protein n=1 Tax=Mikania micrantha TaxID=192012 RepID=A0A5N6P3L6_9ASTR|nr:hypothetical protein E3N88_15092 [Mikania micrantha]
MVHFNLLTSNSLYHTKKFQIQTKVQLSLHNAQLITSSSLSNSQFLLWKQSFLCKSWKLASKVKNTNYKCVMFSANNFFSIDRLTCIWIDLEAMKETISRFVVVPFYTGCWDRSSIREIKNIKVESKPATMEGASSSSSSMVKSKKSWSFVAPISRSDISGVMERMIRSTFKSVTQIFGE